MEIDPTCMCEVLVDMPDVEVLGVTDVGGGVPPLVIEVSPLTH